MELSPLQKQFGEYHLMVKQFHVKMGFPWKDFPDGKETPKTMLFRLRLIFEEAYELMEAIDQNEFEKMCDAYADLLYVVFGLGVTLGLPSEALFREVQRSNMTKDVMNKHGKGGKGPEFEPPDIQGVLFAHHGLQEKLEL